VADGATAAEEIWRRRNEELKRASKSQEAMRPEGEGFSVSGGVGCVEH